MELKERGDETDLPDIGDAFPPPPPPPPPRRRIAREEPLDSFACGLLACVGAGEKLECLACGARCDALLGAAVGAMLGKQFYVIGGLGDSNGDPKRPWKGFDSFIDEQEFFKHVEFGWTPGLSRRATDRVQLTYWQKDRLSAKGTPSGSGWLMSWSWKFDDRWVPFARAGWSDGGGGALAERSLSGGFSYRLAFQDWLTIGAGINKPSEKTHVADLGTEKVLEASYLWQVTANTSVLPDLQRRAGVARHDAVAWGFARAADKLGVDIIEQCEVTGINMDGNKVTGVETTRGTIEAPSKR